MPRCVLVPTERTMPETQKYSVEEQPFCSFSEFLACVLHTFEVRVGVQVYRYMLDHRTSFACGRPLTKPYTPLGAPPKFSLSKAS